MKKLDFEKLLKKKKYKDIIYLHVYSKITLTSSQISKVIKLQKEGVHL